MPSYRPKCLLFFFQDSCAHTSQGEASPDTFGDHHYYSDDDDGEDDEDDDDINVDDDELHLGSEHEAKDDGGADSDAHAQARQLHLVRRGGGGLGVVVDKAGNHGGCKLYKEPFSIGSGIIMQMSDLVLVLVNSV